MENCPATIQEHPLGKKIHATAGMSTMSTMNPTLATSCKPSYCPVIKWNAINWLCLCCNKSLGNLHHESSRWVCCLSAMLATYTQFLSKHTRFNSQRLRRLFGQNSNCWINQWQIYQWIKPTPSPVSHLQIWVHQSPSRSSSPSRIPNMTRRHSHPVPDSRVLLTRDLEHGPTLDWRWLKHNERQASGENNVSRLLKHCC